MSRIEGNSRGQMIAFTGMDKIESKVFMQMRCCTLNEYVNYDMASLVYFLWLSEAAEAAGMLK